VVDAAQLGVIQAVAVEYQEVIGGGGNVGEERIVPLQHHEVRSRRSKDGKGDRDSLLGAEIVKAAGSEIGIDIAQNEIAGKFRARVGVADSIESRGVVAAVVVAGG